MRQPDRPRILPPRPVRNGVHRQDLVPEILAGGGAGDEAGRLERVQHGTPLAIGGEDDAGLAAGAQRLAQAAGEPLDDIGCAPGQVQPVERYAAVEGWVECNQVETLPRNRREQLAWMNRDPVVEVVEQDVDTGAPHRLRIEVEAHYLVAETRREDRADPRAGPHVQRSRPPRRWGNGRDRRGQVAGEKDA